MKSIDDAVFDIGEEKFSIVLRCLLDRLPVLIAGTDKEDVEFFANSLADIMSFRTKLIFYTDFISNNELDMLLQEEEINYDTNRYIVVCPNDALHKALHLFNSFKSWILCYHIMSDESKVNKDGFNARLSFIIQMVQKKIQNFLLIENSNDEIVVNMVGSKFKNSNLKFEKLIYSKAITFVDNSITKMRRIFEQRLSLLKNFSKELREELLDFSFEEQNLKRNIFKIQILEFYNAARRVFSILNKISILNSLNVKTELSDQTILDTVSYSNASFSRLTQFIKAEWGEIFTGEIETEPMKYKEDLIESLWG
ncbi:MAG: hypothetical protein JW776_02855 [Candidatus Lokiarchaeota archaeon]|nr:hypothetical protein [Candidatus Lokiarchaeota archaeon]